MKCYRRFFRLSAREKLLFTEAVFFLFTAKIILLLLPFRICILTIKSHHYETQPPVEILNSVKQAVLRANRFACWKNVCLVQAFAARWMLQWRKIDSSLSIGVKQDSEKIMSAHAWLMVGNRNIVSGAKDYLTIVQY